MTIFSLIVNAFLLVALFWLLYREARDRYKYNRQVNVHIDETNRVAFIAPRPKADDEDIDSISSELRGLYKTVLVFESDVNLRGLKKGGK
ncbi:hypothetical protein [Staphylococcus arlettae]|uniref:hypothetical protein n=1 Tax=Staphylococcus arlettae TaxID=29378 RepID=UPI0021CEFE39|nr:hypothetical protein [Staphylococcus arlettae]UXU53188.1 hypothetical protein MUA71_03680 [Staphylococcus arlettae]